MRAANLLASQAFVVCLAAAVVLCACGDDESSEGDPDAGTDSDADSDSDTDSDSDGDPDTWVVQISGSGDISADAVDYLSDGSLVAAGTFEGTAVFGDGEAELTADGESNLFLVRIDGDGHVMWATKAGSVLGAPILEIAAQTDDTVLVASGFETGTLILGEGEPNETVLDAGGGDSSFVASYDDDGILAWAEQTTWIEDGPSRTIPVADGSVFLVRDFVTSILLDEGGPKETELLGPGTEDLLAARFSTDGTFDWAVSATGIDDLQNPRFDPQPDGSLVCAAADITSSTVTLDYGSPDETIFQGPVGLFVRYDTAGSLDWAAQTLLTEDPNQGKVRFRGATQLDDGSLIGMGRINFDEDDQLTFGPGEPSETVLAEEPGGYMFLVRYAPDGTFVWVETIVGAGASQWSSIATADDQSLLVFGACIGLCTFDVGGPNETMPEISSDFVAKYDATGAFEHVWHAVSSSGGMAYSSSYMAAGPNDTFALVGQFKDDVSFWGDEPDPITLTSGGNYDAFVVQQIH